MNVASIYIALPVSAEMQGESNGRHSSLIEVRCWRVGKKMQFRNSGIMDGILRAAVLPRAVVIN